MKRRPTMTPDRVRDRLAGGENALRTLAVQVAAHEDQSTYTREEVLHLLLAAASVLAQAVKR